MKKYYCPNGSSELDDSVFYIIIEFFGYCLVKTRNTYKLNVIKISELVEHIDI